MPEVSVATRLRFRLVTGKFSTGTGGTQATWTAIFNYHESAALLSNAVEVVEAETTLFQCYQLLQSVVLSTL